MYTEEPRRTISWRDVIRKGLLVVLAALIIILIVWLCTKNNANNKINNHLFDNNTQTNIKVDTTDNTVDDTNNDINSDTDENNDIINSSSYSESFIVNYSYMHDTGKEYLTTNTLPEDGITNKYTLRELILLEGVSTDIFLLYSSSNSLLSIFDEYFQKD